jgi:hypothetical protein
MGEVAGLDNRGVGVPGRGFGVEAIGVCQAQGSEIDENTKELSRCWYRKDVGIMSGLGGVGVGFGYRSSTPRLAKSGQLHKRGVWLTTVTTYISLLSSRVRRQFGRPGSHEQQSAYAIIILDETWYGDASAGTVLMFAWVRNPTSTTRRSARLSGMIPCHG